MSIPYELIFWQRSHLVRGATNIVTKVSFINGYPYLRSSKKNPASLKKDIEIMRLKRVLQE